MDPRVRSLFRRLFHLGLQLPPYGVENVRKRLRVAFSKPERDMDAALARG